MENLIVYAFNTFLSIFVIVDPFSLVPIYLTLTERFSIEENLRTRKKASWIALVTLMIFAFSGSAVFNFFGITLAAFRIAGGILLLLMGIDQLRASSRRVKPEEESEGLHKEDISVFPLATPLLAGPGAISTVVLQGGQAAGIWEHVMLGVSVVAVIVVTYFILKTAPYIYRVLGQTGLNLLTRLMGLILTAISVQYIITGIYDAVRLYN